jgi:glycosyltransferase involved in cell wall biosynthesis
MPVGGIAEQVVDGKTGVLARRVSAQAFADAIRRLMADGRTYASISHHLRESAADRSMDRFLLEIAKEVELLTADRNARS